MENKFLDKLSRSLNVELPERDSFKEYLDLILPEIRQWGEDLYETDYYVGDGGKPWLEFRDSMNFHEAVLHFFNPNGEYLQSVDGNVMRGKWRLIEGTNKMIIDMGSKSELYELAYLDSDFFILRKHGNRTSQYFTMAFEPYYRGLEWKDYVEALFNKYRANHGSYKSVIGVIAVIILIVILFSIF